MNICILFCRNQIRPLLWPQKARAMADESVIASRSVSERVDVRQPADQPVMADPPKLPIGLYGWRKRCLYFLVLLLAVILLVNLGLTVWILVTLNFNINGFGAVEITSSGLRLDGPAEFLGPLYAQNISTDQGSSLLVKSQQSVEVSANGNSHIQVSPSSVNISTASFSVRSEAGQESLLSVDRTEVTVATAQLQVTGALGMFLNGPLETTSISSPANQDLQVQSFSGELSLQGASGVRIEDGSSVAGGVRITSQEDILLTSQNGQVVLNSEQVILPGLPRVAESSDEVYEVCACSNGKLYLTPSTASCSDSSIC